MSVKWRKAWCVTFLLGYFFSENTRLFDIIWASLWENLSPGGGVDKECFKPVSSAIETSLKNEISPAATLHMILSKKRIKRRWSDCADAQAGLRLCCSQTPRRQGFSRWGPYYSCIYDPCNSEWTVTHVFFFFFNSHWKFIFFCWIVSHFIFFTKRCLANKGSSPPTYIWGGGVNLRSVSSQDADKMVILGSFIPRNYFTFYWNNIVFGIKLQLRSWSIKRYYSFRPIASYRDARGEDINAHTHAHLFLLKWSVTLSEIACRLPGFQRDRARIMIICKSIGVSSPGNIYVHVYKYICSIRRDSYRVGGYR